MVIILLKKGMRPEKRVVSFVENCLFTTLTNVNFDPEVHVKLLQEAQKIKDELRQQTRWHRNGKYLYGVPAAGDKE